MYAVVLVGGFGTRLRPLTNDVPKPVLPVAHRPMIVRLVERLQQAGVTEVVLALGFKPEPFMELFPTGTHDGVRLHYAVEPEPLDTAGAIRFAADALGIDDTFVVANGDIVTDLDVGVLVDHHRSSGAAATLHLTPVDDPSAYGVVEIQGGGRVARFVEKPTPGETDSNLINAGTYVFEANVLDMIPALERTSLERVTFPKLVEYGTLYGVPTDDYWIDVGRPEPYRLANLDLIAGRRTTTEPGIAESANVSSEAVIVESVVGHGSDVAAAHISESVLLPGAVVGAGAVLERSIIAGSVGVGAVVRDCVIGATGHVPDGVTLDGVSIPGVE